MKLNPNKKLLAASVAALAVAGGGAAIAAGTFTSPKAESQAIVSDAAKQLGVTPAALSQALQKAFENRIDAAVSAGRLTKAQGAELKSRIASGGLPLFGHGFGSGRHEGPPGLDAAASYLGLTRDRLRSELEAGKTLAQLAQAKGKTADGLIQALVVDAQKELAAAVSAGRLTSSEEQTMLANLKAHVTDLVNGKVGPGLGEHDRFGAGPGPGLPPSGAPTL